MGSDDGSDARDTRGRDPRGPATPAHPAALLRSAWTGRHSAEDRKILEELLDVSGQADLMAGAAALAPEEAISLAVFDAGDVAVLSEPEFDAAFPEPGAIPDLRRLAAQARRSGSAWGLLETADGAAVLVWAASGSSAAKWARSAQARQALERPGRVLALLFAPARSSALAARAAEAFGLSLPEARVAEAFLFAPTLEIAAAQVGVGRETARDAMARIMAKTGVRRSTEVVRRLTELMSGAPVDAPLSGEILCDAFGLTPAEAGVALQVAAGATHREAADALGLKLGTVQTYAKSALDKTGVARGKDLARLVAEMRALAHLVTAGEPVFVSGAQAPRLRILPRPNGRRTAFLDYGPLSHPPAMIFHGFTAGRSLPPRLVRALQLRGLRPMVLQRPGFGLTSPADGDYLACAADDLWALVRALGFEQMTLFARDGGTAAALAFAEAHPQAVAGAVLMNPRSPRGLPRATGPRPVQRLAQQILRHPQAVAGLGELIRRRTRTDFLEAALRQTLRAHGGDVAALEDAAVRAQLVRDIQAQFAHTSAGYAAEHLLYARGWSAPVVHGTGPWTVVSLGAFGRAAEADPWRGLPGASFVHLEDAGVLAQFTHAEALGELIAGAARGGAQPSAKTGP